MATVARTSEPFWKDATRKDPRLIEQADRHKSIGSFDGSESLHSSRCVQGSSTIE
ncbi:hypothetical protein [Rhodovulum steppense]|uniref:hypothetical protein n=1 Tax=Rhodovulum steppense TaxID=540251 RepID=UPI0014047E55|nr:hypothetical protein [Rhodovulum steppense]